MRNKIQVSIAIILIGLFSFSALGQVVPPPVPPPPPPGLPIDSGLMILLGCGLIYGMKKIKNSSS